MILARIALRNVCKNWRHSLSALLSISAGFIALVLFNGYIDDIQNMNISFFQSRNEMGHFFIQDHRIFSKEGMAEPWKYYINPADQDVLQNFFKKHNNLIKISVRYLDFQGVITNGQQSTIVIGRGVDVPEAYQIRGPRWQWNSTYGLPLHLSTQKNDILLGQGLSKKLGCKWVSDSGLQPSLGFYEQKVRPFECNSLDMQIATLTFTAQLNALDVKTIGLIDGGIKEVDENLAVTSLETAQELLDTKLVSFLSVELYRDLDFENVESIFKSEVQSARPHLKLTRWQEHPYGSVYRKTMSFLILFKNFFVAVILIISVMSVINTLIKTVRERSPEIGTMRSLGFRSAQVLKLFLYEGSLLALFECSIGAVLALVISFIINRLQILYKAGMLSEPVMFQIAVSFKIYLAAFGVLAVVSMLASYLVTRQLLKQKIIFNLKEA